MEAPLLDNENQRNEVIAVLGLLGEEHDRAFDAVVSLTQMSTGLPICAFSIVDQQRQFFKASEGLDIRETPREVSFCAWAINQPDLNDIMVVQSPLVEERFRDNWLVTGDFNLRFYAGLPVCAPNGLPVGTICLIDKVKQSITPKIEFALQHAKLLLENQLLLTQQAAQDYLTTIYRQQEPGIAVANNSDARSVK